MSGPTSMFSVLVDWVPFSSRPAPGGYHTYAITCERCGDSETLTDGLSSRPVNWMINHRTSCTR